MYIPTATIDGFVWQGNYAVSEIVWVGKKKLTMSCAPDSIFGGEQVTCNAGTSPAGGTISDLEWSYSGQAEQPSHSGTTWTAKLNSVGVVTVTGLVDGVRQAACDTVHCKAFNDSIATDPNLADPDLQKQFLQLWHDSDPYGPAPVEKAAFIAEDPSTGKRRLVRWLHSGRCGADPTDTPNVTVAEIVGWIHTHPNTPGDIVPVNDPTCKKGREFVDYPSDDDVNMAAHPHLKGKPGYIMNRSQVVRFEFDLSSNFSQTEFPWSSTCE